MEKHESELTPEYADNHTGQGVASLNLKDRGRRIVVSLRPAWIYNIHQQTVPAACLDTYLQSQHLV